MAILTRLYVGCKSWRCTADLRLDDVPGFYFIASELIYEGPPFHLTCPACGKTHRYKLSDVTVRYAGDALGGVMPVRISRR
jgi:hypothetical protein